MFDTCIHCGRKACNCNSRSSEFIPLTRGPEIITPPSHKEILRLKEKLLDKLIAEIVNKAELEKGKREGVEGKLALTKAEWREIAEKTHAELEKRGWFESGSGIR